MSSNGSAYPAASVEQSDVKPGAVREAEMMTAGVGESVNVQKNVSAEAEMSSSSASPSVSETLNQSGGTATVQQHVSSAALLSESAASASPSTTADMKGAQLLVCLCAVRLCCLLLSECVGKQFIKHISNTCLQ